MRKVLVSLLVVAMVLGLVGSAFAGFTDTTKDANAAYIDKAAAFSWLKGYADGSFKPAGNITRAEFCAVIVRALGLESAAASTSGLTTKFADVKSTDWFAGYVNVAVNKGVVKGYPDGSFKPNANVSNAEAITMIVRALNREADATGEWPVGHISVAASLSIISSGFASNALATRGDVARYVSKAADVPWKELTTNGWVESTATPPSSFIKANTIRKYTGNVNDTDPANKTVTINVTAGPTSSDLGMKTYTLDDKYAIAGGVGLLDIKGYSVDLFRNNDTGKVLFIEPTTTVTKKTGDVRGFQWETTGGNTYLYFYLYDDTTKYTAIQATTNTGVTVASLIRNGQTMGGNGAANTIKIDDSLSFFIGNDGNVSYINGRGYDKTRWIVTDLYTAGTPMSITIKAAGNSAVTYNVNAETKIELNGAEAKFTDFKKGDVVSIAADPNSTSTASIINGTNKSVTGKITAKRRTDSEDGITRYYISIDGVEYRWESTSEVKDNEAYKSAAIIFGEGTAPDPTTAAIKVGQAVTIYLSQRGRIKYIDITSGVADQGKIKRFVINSSSSYDTWVMDMKGTETTYEIAKAANTGTSLHTTLAANYSAAFGTVVGGRTQIGRILRAGDYVSLTIDTDGRISDAVLLADPEAQYVLGTGNYGAAMPPWSAAAAPWATYQIYKLGDVYSGDKIVTLNSMAYLVTNDTLLYVNGNPGSMGSVAKDAYAAVAFDPTAGSVKLRALIVDGFASMDTAAMVCTATTLKGYDKATEPWSLVEVYNGTTLLGQDYSDDAGGYRIPLAGNRGSNTGYNGGFSITFGGPAVASGTTLTVKVTDRFGNSTSGQVKVP